MVFHRLAACCSLRDSGFLYVFLNDLLGQSRHLIRSHCERFGDTSLLIQQIGRRRSQIRERLGNASVSRKAEWGILARALRASLRFALGIRRAQGAAVAHCASRIPAVSARDWGRSDRKNRTAGLQWTSSTRLPRKPSSETAMPCRSPRLNAGNSVPILRPCWVQVTCKRGNALLERLESQENASLLLDNLVKADPDTQENEYQNYISEHE